MRTGTLHKRVVRRSMRIAAHLGLLFALLLPALQLMAQQQKADGKLPQVTITDAAGRVHKVMLMRNTTPAQRKAAANRAKDLKAKAGDQRQQALKAQKGGKK